MTLASKRLASVLAVAFAVGCIALSVAAFWQHNVHNSKVDDAEAHETIATSVRNAEAEGQIAATLMNQYISTGDETYLAELRSHANAGIQSLTFAVSAAGGDTNGFLNKGTQFMQAAGQVIALRQSGDVEGAVSSLNQIMPQFDDFIAAQDQFIAEEEQAASSGRSDADRASDLIVGFSAGAVVLAVGASGAGLFAVRKDDSRQGLSRIPAA